MRRLLRIAFAAASVLSLVLCLTLSAVWVRSYWVGDVLDWHAGKGGDDAGHHGVRPRRPERRPAQKDVAGDRLAIPRLRRMCTHSPLRSSPQ
ncbi:MAG TPA: hypothetical protein VMZ71_07640, partial [Gemmataceae bacterium]|nr:hypothetical protein [Gemmataceae bacterium]